MPRIARETWVVNTEAVSIYVDAGAGDDASGDGSVGNPYQTIQHAVDSLPVVVGAPATIHLAAGTYRETVTIARTCAAEIIILGDEAAPESHVISGADAGAPTTPVRAVGILVEGSSLVYLKGITVEYCTGTTFLAGGILVRGVANVRLYRLDVETCDISIALRERGIAAIYGDLNLTGTKPGVASTMGIHVREQGLLSCERHVTPDHIVTITEHQYGINWMGGSSTQLEDVDFVIANSQLWSGSVGLFVQQGQYHQIRADIDKFATGVSAYNNSYIDHDGTAVTNCTVGFHAHTDAVIDVDDPTLTGTGTPYEISSGGIISEANPSRFGAAIIGADAVADSVAVWADAYSVKGVAGASGSFTTVDGKTVTVTNGVITNIV